MDPAKIQQLDATSAEVTQLHAALSNQGAMVGQNRQDLQAIGTAVAALTQQVTALTTAVEKHLEKAPAATPAGHDDYWLNDPVVAQNRDNATPKQKEVRLPPPERYDGDPGKCQGFLTQCTLAFELQKRCFPTHRTKVAFIISLLTGRALSWASQAWEQERDFCFDIKEFMAEMKKVFDHPVTGREAAKRLTTICQGARSVADYAIDFRTLATEVGWSSGPLITLFQEGLTDSLKDELATRDIPDDLDGFIDLAIRIDNRLRERGRDRGRGTRLSTNIRLPSDSEPAPVTQMAVSGPSPSTGEPMQLGRTKLTKEEKERRARMNCCFYCGQPNHMASSCPLKGQAHQ